jgi:hypothetical protein
VVPLKTFPEEEEQEEKGRREKETKIEERG